MKIMSNIISYLSCVKYFVLLIYYIVVIVVGLLLN